MNQINKGIVRSDGRSVTHQLLDETLFNENDYGLRPGHVGASDPGVFRQKTTDSDLVTIQDYTGVGYFEEMANEEDYPQSTIQAGPAVSMPVRKFGKKINISQDFQEDDNLFDITSRAVSELGTKAMLTMDKRAYEPFREATNTDSRYLTVDGEPLLSDSHRTTTGDTVDNKIEYDPSTADLNDVIEDMVIRLEDQLNEDGTLGGHQPAILLVAPRKHKEVYQVLESDLEAGGDKNDLNYWSSIYPGLRVVTSPWIASTRGGDDDTMFMLSGNHEIRRYVRKGLTTDYIPASMNKDTDHHTYKARFRELSIVPTYRGVVGAVSSN